MAAPTTPHPSRLPSGNWTTDRVHSSACFSLDGLQAGCDDVRARLAVRPDGEAALSAAVPAISLRLESTALRRDGDVLELAGRLTFADRTLPVTAMGTVAAPAGGLRVALETRIDRRQFGLDWHLPALGHEVRIHLDLALNRS